MSRGQYIVRSWSKALRERGREVHIYTDSGCGSDQKRNMNLLCTVLSGWSVLIFFIPYHFTYLLYITLKWTRIGVQTVQTELDQSSAMCCFAVPPVNVWVVYTDYTQVACMYSCAQFPGLRAEWAWAVSRKRPPVRAVGRCRAALQRLDVNTSKFLRVPYSAKCLPGK